MSKLILVVLLAIGGIALAEPYPDTLWTRTFGGAGKDAGYCVVQTLDGGYLVAGKLGRCVQDNSCAIVVKTDSNGNTLWSRTLVDSTSKWFYSVKQTTDGGYILVGLCDLGRESADLYLVKIDDNGDTLWTRVFRDSWVDVGNDVQQTSDGGYIIAAYTYFPRRGFYLVKMDKMGNILWDRDYYKAGRGVVASVRQIADGGYIAAGTINSVSRESGDFYLVRTDAKGDTVWTRTYGGSAGDGACIVRPVSDGGFIVLGYTSSYGEGKEDFYLVKIDNMGDVLWQRTYGGEREDWPLSMESTNDGGCVLAGHTRSFGERQWDFYIIKVDSLGHEQWTKTYGGTEHETAYSIKQTSDNGYIISGVTSSYGEGDWDIYLIKTGPDKK